MKYGVLITSAINTKFGVYSTEQRMAQTLATIADVKLRLPGAKIFLLEMAGIPLTNEQRDTLGKVVDTVIDFTSDADVQGLFHSTDNWDIVKNVTEVLCFGRALKTLISTEQINQFDRLFKISGRYRIGDNFDSKFYDEYKNQSLIVVGQSKASQFPEEVTQVNRQYMSRLWSWPASLTQEITQVYDNSLQFMYERLAAGGYVDIEHCLYKFLDRSKVLEKEVLGVYGNIAPNGAPIND